MDESILFWEASPSDVWYIFFSLLSLLIFASVFEICLKHRKKFIILAFCIALLLALPFARYVVLHNYLEKESYTLVVNMAYPFGYEYAEAEAGAQFSQPFLCWYRMDHEHKLVFIESGNNEVPPASLEDIVFLD